MNHTSVEATNVSGSKEFLTKVNQLRNGTGPYKFKSHEFETSVKVVENE